MAEPAPGNITRMSLDQAEKQVQISTVAHDKPPRKPLSFWLAFLSLNLAVFIVSLDATALGVAIPVITKELDGTSLEAFWANLSFLLAVVITQPIYTSVSNVLGRAIPLYAAYILFLVGSIVFAISKSMGILILGRLLQGLGGGGLDVLGEIIVTDITTLKERPLYLGLFALPMAGGGIFGPMIGAIFSQYASWRWIGWVNLPLIAVALPLSFFFLRLRPINTTFGERLRMLDWIGIFLFATGSTLVALPMSWAGSMYPWSSWKTLVPLIIGAITLVGFVFYETKPVEPVFPRRIFGNITANATLLGSFIHGAILYSVVLYAPLFFQAVYLESPFKASVSILPVSSTIVGFSVIAAVGVEFVRKYRVGIIASWIMIATGCGLWALWQRSSSLALKSGLQVVAGLGIGNLFSLLVIPMQACVSNVDDAGLAVGILVSFRLFGGLIGLAICATIFNNIFEHRISDLGDLVGADVREAISFIPALKASHLESSVLESIIDAYRESMMSIFLFLSGLGVVGFISSLFTKELTIESEDLGRQHLEAPS